MLFRGEPACSVTSGVAGVYSSAPRSLGTFLSAAFLAFSIGAAAHDIPVDATVQTILKPAGQRLHLLVRVPLEAIRDVDFPDNGRGYLDIEKLLPLMPDAATIWISNFIEIYEGEIRLPRPRVVATQVSLGSDRSFTSYEEAVAHITGPRLSTSANVVWNQVMLDVLFDYPIRSDRSEFSIHPRLTRLASKVATVLRFYPAGGPVRAFEFPGDPGLIRLDPSWRQAAGRFVEMGFFHILDGIDHLLFLFCLVIPFRRFRSLIAPVTAFTVAHSITLIASAFNFAPDALWFPPLIETLIAISIVYMALENIVGGRSLQRRWMIAFGFGLIHGFGFSFALRTTLQFAGSHLLASLLSFNVGVELGQVLVLLLLIPALQLLFRYAVAERTGVIILSALVAHTGWHWMLERADRLRQFRIQWPGFNAAVAAMALWWLVWILVAAALVWLVAGFIHQRYRRAVGSDAAAGAD